MAVVVGFHRDVICCGEARSAWHGSLQVAWEAVRDEWQ